MNITSYTVHVTVHGRSGTEPRSVTCDYVATATSAQDAVERVREHLKGSLVESCSTMRPLEFAASVMHHGDVFALQETPKVEVEPLRVPKIVNEDDSDDEFWHACSTEVKNLWKKGDTKGPVNDGEGVRLYWNAFDTTWQLQTRAYRRNEGGQISNQFMMGASSLDAEGMRRLRDAITVELVRAGLEEMP